MRAAWLAITCGLSVCLAGCDGKNGDKAADSATAGPAADSVADTASITAAQKISDAIGGCEMPANATHKSRVVALEKNRIVLLACSQGAYSYTDRLFAVDAKGGARLLSLPDFGADGWFASDQASMAELDAGTGVLTTERKIDGKDACGSEGRYQWSGVRFDLQELRFQACDDSSTQGPPFPVIWPAPSVAGADLTNSAPAP
ncbi:MAG: DUF1176 domain-containing protein [Alphaproteobacteria bacterium]|nr:DUF1176 domain-containing protein [Alphaproteobacteria bacterium]